METIGEAFREALQLIISLDPTVVEITLRSLGVTFSALIISTVFGIPLGTWLALTFFRGQRFIVATVYTGMALPPVVVGVLVYLLLSRTGPFGSLQWLFTVRAMIIAQTILALPVIIGLTMSSVRSVDPTLRTQLRSLGATHWQITPTILREARFGLIVGIVAGFGAIISEVGAVLLVGGNIEGHTRVLTTAIVLETRRGRFDVALALGIILLSLSFVANAIMMLGQGRVTHSS